MQRYFIEVAYRGEGFAGFQLQQNAQTIQGAVEDALRIYFRKPYSLTGSSRTDTDVNALQNFFHVDSDEVWEADKVRYRLNAILPAGIAINGIYAVHAEAHCRFDATSRTYAYRIYRKKDPFLAGRAYYYPYPLRMDLLKEAADEARKHTHFEAFSKRNTQVRNYACTVLRSEWFEEDGIWRYEVEGNRFLRGMVRGLVATMLRVGSGKMEMDAFRALLRQRIHATADFSAPGHGLYLVRVLYPYEEAFRKD